MGVPFESLLPYAICIGFFSLTGAGLSKLRHMQNGGKRARHSVDQWDKQMMDRDRRLTGFVRGQTDNVKAPKGFELSNPWRLEPGTT
ncbi:Putative NADH dehydrogenase [ubiquinone] (complex I), alpha subcomplex subunit 1 [Septoria linicola]|uniref:NADH dehydrogenase [ubiquinone] 1 alpha subcomplex subunit 1 n=1 Tax=Septoria linicola TaxID=215465 RepID=A0A9Q9EIR1_9PEZI|nr:putative NADH dehydrogenase [ubiquinone] (complex I), alpha subcomplex subunit 1 [Septoria linicola]USW52290.1 Putative NADH dehydrogenase [ubiquinone] (complex I), alpha subcomplex subunit 1 [Septoria linicola]